MPESRMTLMTIGGGAWVGKEVQNIKDFFTNNELTDKGSIKICLLG